MSRKLTNNKLVGTFPNGDNSIGGNSNRWLPLSRSTLVEGVDQQDWPNGKFENRSRNKQVKRRTFIFMD